jgi:hypothetical protein
MQSKVIFMRKAEANAVCGTLTQTSKMPCKSYSLPTEACQTGYKMAQIDGSICSACYANKGFYRAYESTIKPSQFARLDSVHEAMKDTTQGDLWVSGMVALIGNDEFFRHHDSGDLQGVAHLELIARVAQLTPKTRHWLPTREYGMVKQYIAKHGALPENLIVRLSAMYPDKPVKVPLSLQGVANVAVSNVHTGQPMGTACNAPNQNGACNDCRLCWSTDTVSYALH